VNVPVCPLGIVTEEGVALNDRELEAVPPDPLVEAQDGV